jgi:hypothetical protein
MTTTNQSCPSCGHENPQGADFCVSCRAVLSPNQRSTHPQCQQVERLPHSGLGIASFVVGLVSAVLFSVYIAAYAMSYRGQFDPGDGIVVILLLVLFFVESAVGSVIALALSITALFQKQRNRLFAILGMVFSAAAALSVLSFVVMNFSYW